MASADFLRFVVTMLRFEFVYSFTAARPPQVSITAFTSYICCTYTLKFGQYRTLFCLGNSSVSSMPFMQFLFVRPRLCFGLPSDSASRRMPLPPADSSYRLACSGSGLSPPCCSACRAHQNTRPIRTMTVHIGRIFCIVTVIEPLSQYETLSKKVNKKKSSKRNADSRGVAPNHVMFGALPQTHA